MDDIVFRIGVVGSLEAQGGLTVLPLHILDVGDGDIPTFNVYIGGLLPFVSFFCQEAVVAILALKVDGHIAFRSVDGIHDEVTIGFLEIHAILGANGEDAVAGDGGIRDGTAAGFEDQVLPFGSTDGDTIQCAAGFQAHFSAGGEATAAGNISFTDEIDGALAGNGRKSAGGLSSDGAHRRHGDRISTDGEIATFSGRKSQDLVTGELRGIGEIDLHAIGLRADVGVTAIGARGGQCDGGALYVRRALQGRLGIGDPFLDATGSEGDQEILGRLRRTYQDFCFFGLGEEVIAGKHGFYDRCIAVDVTLICIDGFHIGRDVSRRPGADGGVLQLIIARLLSRDVFVHVDALGRDGALRAFVQGVYAVFIHIGFESLEFIVLALHFRNELVFLFPRGLATAFEDRRIAPSQELLLRVFVVEVGVVVIHEGAIGGKGDGAVLRNDAIQVQVAAGIGDGNIPISRCLEAVVLPFLGCGLHHEGVVATDSATGRELDAVCGDDGIRHLGNIAVCGERSYTAGSDGTGCDTVVHHLDRKVALRTAADSLRAGADGCIRRAGAAGGGIHGKAAGVNVAASSLADGSARESRCAAAIGERAIDDHVSAAAIDFKCAAGFITNEIDADAIVRLHGILVYLGVRFLFHQLVIVFLRQAQGVPQALCLLRILYGLQPRIVRLGRNLHTILGIRCRSGQVIAIGDDSAAIQGAHISQLIIRDGSTPIEQILAARRRIFDAPPIHLCFVELIGGRVTAILAGLQGVVAAGLRRVSSDAGMYLARLIGFSIGVAQDGLGDHAIVSGVGGLADDLTGLAVEIGDFDLSFGAFPGGEGAKLDILTALVIDDDLAIAIQGFDGRLAGVIGGIDDGTHDGNLTAMDFDVIHDEAARLKIIGEPVCPFAGGPLHADRAAGRYFAGTGDSDLLVPIHIVQGVILRDGDIEIGHSALDGGIDIHIAGADENISIRQDAASQISALLSAIIERCAADTENTLGLGVVALDVIAIVDLHIHRAGIDGAIGVDIPILAGYGHIASGVVDVARKSSVRCGIERDIGSSTIFHTGVIGRLEGIQDGNRGGLVAFAISGSDVEADGLRCILIGLSDGIIHISFERYIIIVNGTALSGAVGALTSYHFHVAHLKIVRRCIGDGDLRVAAGSQSAATGYIVPFKEDVPQLGGDVADLYIMGHLGISHIVKQVIRTVRQIAIGPHIRRGSITVHRGDFIAIRGDELASRLCATYTRAKESLGGLDLRLQIGLVLEALPLRAIYRIELFGERFHVAVGVFAGILSHRCLVGLVVSSHGFAIGRLCSRHGSRCVVIGRLRTTDEAVLRFPVSLCLVISVFCCLIVCYDLLIGMCAICYIGIKGHIGFSGRFLYRRRRST